MPTTDGYNGAYSGQQIDETLGAANSHIADKNNPHGVTAAQAGAAPAEHTHDASEINSGILAVARGGTGKSSWTANRLIYPSSSAALAQLAFPRVAGSVLRQGTSGAPYWTSLSDLAAAMGGVQIETGSYQGTGTSGKGNPVSLTFSMDPKIVFIQIKEEVLLRCLPLIRGVSRSGINTSSGSTSLAVWVTWGTRTVSWYGQSDEYMLNKNGATYYYVAFG